MSWIRRRTILLINSMLTDYEGSSNFKKAMISAFMHHFPGQMTCVEFDAFMSDYLDGSLSEVQKNKFNFHLDACPMCRNHLSDYKITIELARLTAVDELAAVPAQQELINAILAAREPKAE